jgi:hypothetical protein
VCLENDIYKEKAICGSQSVTVNTVTRAHLSFISVTRKIHNNEKSIYYDNWMKLIMCTNQREVMTRCHWVQNHLFLVPNYLSGHQIFKIFWYVDIYIHIYKYICIYAHRHIHAHIQVHPFLCNFITASSYGEISASGWPLFIKILTC